MNLCVKQSPSTLKQRFFDAGPSANQSCEERQVARRARMEYEIMVYQEWEAVLGKEVAAKCAPKIHYFDSENLATVMESLGSYHVLETSLFHGIPDQRVAANVGRALALIHASTHSSRVTPAQAARFASKFANAELRRVHVEHVLSGDVHNPKAVEELRRDGLTSQLERLKSLYRGEGSEGRTDLCLCHGDLRVGAVVVEPESGEVKLLDPEFAIYGPPGVDLGRLLSGYVLAFVARAAQLSEGAGRILAAISQVWASYAQAMAEGSIAPDVLERAGEDAASFACAYVVLDALGGTECSLLQMPDAAKQAKVKRHVLDWARRCLKAERGGGVQSFVDELRKLEASIAKPVKPQRFPHCLSPRFSSRS